MKKPACGIWYMEIQKLDLRGDEDDTIAKLTAWVERGTRAGAEPGADACFETRGVFADGIYFGMKWAGCFTKRPVTLSADPEHEEMAATFMRDHRLNWDTSEALDDLTHLLTTIARTGRTP